MIWLDNSKSSTFLQQNRFRFKSPIIFDAKSTSAVFLRILMSGYVFYSYIIWFIAHQYHVSVWASTGSGEKANFGRVTLTLHGDSGLNESFPMTK